MYGFSDQLKAIPLTRFSAPLQGSSRYSTPTAGNSIEHLFATGPVRGGIPYTRTGPWTTTNDLDVRPPGQRREPHSRTPRRRSADPRDRVLRRGRVRARHLTEDEDPRARGAGEPARAAG